ncbi:hypothetical protein [Streptomyces platensis]|uniref:hypothetical protein n=1 Tax=Streptomyces platensis TaxID=58346 RepID=UPI00367B9DBC
MCLVRHGLPESSALIRATLLNSGVSSLRSDYLITGDKERAEAALDELCAGIDSCVDHGG